MKVTLAYGRTPLEISLPEGRTDVIRPTFLPGLNDEHDAVIAALRKPIGCQPLGSLVSPQTRICIAFTDITRATPNERLIPWLLDHLNHVPSENIVLLNQLGTHRPNTPAELERMLTPEVCERYRVINHEPTNPDALVRVGHLRDGSPALLNRTLIEADLRVITGFIEPHFFAGFSGGPKGIIPGCAGLETVMANHRPENLNHPRATFGITDGNPLWEEIRDVALRSGPSFLLNVSLNPDQQITGVFAGDLIQAHRAGCDFVRRSALQSVSQRYDIVITTNSGYPLDLNLYQAVKGLCAAARIVKKGGTIIVAAECREGVPADSPYHRLLRSGSSPQQLLSRLSTASSHHAEQWQVQLQAIAQRDAEVLLYSSLDDPAARECHFTPCPDIKAAVEDCLRELNNEGRVAVLPDGPLTIPCVKDRN